MKGVMVKGIQPVAVDKLWLVLEYTKVEPVVSVVQAAPAVNAVVVLFLR
jgi:hypothetical protein